MIRQATIKDLKRINELLYQVQDIHAKGRPDIFKIGTKKFSDDELKDIVTNSDLKFYIYEIDNLLIGYICLKIINDEESNSKKKRKELYIEDLCVDEKYRNQGIGKELFEYSKALAKNNNCEYVTLNVWELNKKAKSFYEKEGLRPLKTIMELKI